MAADGTTAPYVDDPTSPIDQYASSVLFSFIGVCVFLSCVVCGFWAYRAWSTHGFYLKDFARLSKEARELSVETIRFRRDVDQDSTAEWPTKISNIELLGACDEWDASTRISLAAWDDIIQPDEGFVLTEGTTDLERGNLEKGKGDVLAKSRVKRHGRYVIGLMRKKCLEGVERRKVLSPQLHRAHADVLSRKINTQCSRTNRRLTNGLIIKHEKDLNPEQPHAPNASHPILSIDTFVPSTISALLTPPRAASCPVLDEAGNPGLHVPLGKHSYF